MNLIFRCSSLHRLMGNAKSIDESLLNDEIKAIQKIVKAKRTYEQQKVLDDLLDKTLSAGAKTLVKEMVRKEKHNAPPKFTGSKETNKGNLVEDDAIIFLMQQEFISAEKNVQRFTNEWITGEPDIISNGIVYDTKCPWTYWTMDYFADDIESKALDAGYDWQQLGYMWLLRENKDNPPLIVDQAQLKFILMPTPKECLTRYDDQYTHIDFVEEMNPKDRISTYKIQYDESKIELIKIKIEAARKYAETLEFKG